MRDPADLSQGQWLETASFYDEKAKPLQLQSDNEKGGLESVSTRYDFEGKPLSSYQVHQNPQSTAGVLRVLTLMDYDAQERLLAVKKQVNNTGTPRITVQNEYDELGQLKTKHLGTGLQDLAYEYNIRGWLTAMNKDYVNSGSGAGRFGQTLSYDHGFSHQQYNGNIAGVQWRSAGDGEARAYGFDYDNVNRLLKADFTQYTSSAWNNSAGVDFSMQMGDGADPATAYDQNGNIRQMWQKGLKLQSSDWIDKLTYTYLPNSNRLQNVLDYKNDPATRLGDFRTSALHPQKTQKDNEAAAQGTVDLTTITDYSYDVNGNMTRDLNKDIATPDNQDGIVYNFLNLPAQVQIKKDGSSSKGTITYVYDAGGTKRQKIVTENNVSVSYNGQSYTSNVKTTTSYEGAFIYEGKYYDNNSLAALNVEDQLQFFGHEEGRIRPTADPANPFVYDYFLKDHLGNVRMVLTEEQKTDAYPAATMETAQGTAEEALYANVSATRVDLPSGYPTDTYTSPDNKVARVSGATGGNKGGPSIVLKVMSGDRFNLRGSAWYKLKGSTPSSPNPITDLATILASSLGGAMGAKATPAEITSSGVLSPGVTSFFSSQDYTSSRPKAYVNWILLDEQFNYVSASSGSEQVGADNTLNVHQFTGLPVTKNGYLYIYVSNETPNVDVFFDNLQVTHVRGPLLEETHYYPFGLTMAGISSKAVAFGQPENKNKFNKQTELNTDFDIDLYETNFRLYDQQLGRFWKIDPLADLAFEYSPYTYANNNPISINDPLGLINDTTGKNPEILPTVTVYTAAKGSTAYNLNNNGYDWAQYWVVTEMTKFHRTSEDLETWMNIHSKLLTQDAWNRLKSALSPYAFRYREIRDRAWKAEGEIFKTTLILLGTEFGSEILFGVLEEGEAIAVTEEITEAAEAAGVGKTGVQANKAAGDAFRDELAEGLRQEGREVTTEVSKKTPFGTRRIDIEVKYNGKVQGGIETKVGNSRYHTSQRLKDAWLEKVKGYPVNVVRKP